MTTHHTTNERIAVLRIVAIYAVAGSMWIYLSDTAVGLLPQDRQATISTYKGLLFIALTSLLLHFLISRFAASISEKNRQLKVSEDRFQSIFHGISDAVLIHDAATGTIIDVNRTACELFGYTHAELVSLSVDDISLGTSPYSQSEALEWLSRAAEGTPQQFEWCCRHRTGTTFWTEISMRAETIGVQASIIVSVRDISERKQSLEEFHAIIRTTKDGFNIADSRGRLLEVNQQYCDMVGYTRAELLQMSVPDLEAREQADEVAEHIRRIIATGSDHFETRHRRKDGTVIDIQVSITYLPKFGGRFYSFVRDISDARRAEELLKQSDTMLNNLSQQVPGVLFQTIISPDGHACTPYSSEQLYDIYELSPADIRDNLNQLFGRFHPDDRERIIASTAAATATLGRWECEYRVLLPRQGLKWLYGTAQPQKLDDGSTVMYGIIMDITERKQAEEQLRLSEEKFATAFRASPDAVNLTRSSDGRYLEVNEGFTEITGFTAEDAVGRSALELNIWVDPQDRARLVRELEEHGIVKNLEAEFRRKDGSTLTGHMSACLLTFGGEPCILSITRDITDRITIQNERLKMQKLESLGVLAGGIAHDFNNILTGIMGNISLAQRFLDPSHRSSSVLQEAEKASQRATDLAHQLLTFAKGGEPVKKTVHAHQLVSASASLVLRGSNVHSVITIPEDLSPLEVDEGQINQAFNNIIINAAQAMPSGGSITITGENAALPPDNTMALPEGNYVRFTFTDTGCGMSEDTVKRIFDPYFTTKAGGNGLGLASAYSIVTKHGGHIGASSVPGQGSSFTILLPASDSLPPKPGIEAQHAGTHRYSGKAVLVMDDEEMIRDLASEMLQEMGFHVWTCTNGDEAITLYKSAFGSDTPFLAVIMDLTVPAAKGGKEAAREILDFDPEARLIVSSGYSNDPVMADFAHYGFISAIAKPYSFHTLATTMNRL